jgi:hypothetical protein
MKRLLPLAIALAALCAQPVSAQIADGFYHIKNVTTGRCISINDTNPKNYKVSLSAGDVNLGGLRTYLSYDTVSVSPSCVIYVKRLDNGQYDLCGQGSSLYTMSSGRGVDFNFRSDKTFKISASAQGMTKTLSDGSPSTKDSWLMSRLTTTQIWDARPVNTTDEYIGIRPDVRTADGHYYGTIYAGFSFRLVSDGMAAFCIDNAGGAGFTMSQIEEDVIPGATPVVIRCTSSNPAENKIEPVIDGSSFEGANCLRGVFCSISVAGHHNTTPFDALTMRVLGLNDKGELAFVSKPPAGRLYKDLFLMANKAYLKVNPKDEDVMTLGGSTSIDAVRTKTNTPDGIYTLTGVRISENTPLRPGIYIQNGKKRIVR